MPEYASGWRATSAQAAKRSRCFGARAKARPRSPGIDWKPGDELILCDNEFPSNVIPWLPIRERGAHVRFLDASRERLTPPCSRRRSASARALSRSRGCRTTTGTARLAGLAEVAAPARRVALRGRHPGLGAFPARRARGRVDALYGAGAKWMLALQGAGFLYVREDLIDRLTVASPRLALRGRHVGLPRYEQPWSPHALRTKAARRISSARSRSNARWISSSAAGRIASPRTSCADGPLARRTPACRCGGPDAARSRDIVGYRDIPDAGPR